MLMNLTRPLGQGKMVLFIFLGWLLAFPAIALANDYKNFSMGCTNISLKSSYMKAECLDYDGLQSRKNTLDLDLCVGIDASSLTLQWAMMGKMSGYCESCQLDSTAPPVLSCVCQYTDSHSPVNSTLKLDDGIGNQNGTLYCHGGQGTISW
ncbi:hypothetical protein QBC34DRAFT_384664 [Podospora aff. communis PSN243]|uniref:Cyanovirin-N domain-containing protein n=1 Tax=Podospora aff. communis PSN243 TaxID=3040156 RepID=A0AAV9GAA4_9PEZI|nr:hypothetical protein QBC34DRAFT_384664 [Podospora aff. communis PSN243]